VAREIGFTVRQVRRAESHLARHGWLIVSGTTGPHKTRRYVLALGADCHCTGRVHTPERRTPIAATEDIMSGERRTPTADTSQVNGQIHKEAPRGEVKRGAEIQDPYAERPPCIGHCGRPARRACVTCWDHAYLESVSHG
jgi:hypothetical protein